VGVTTSLPLLILILGSYDPNTKQVLYAVKDEIAKLSTFYDELTLIPVLLADIEIYDLKSDVYRLALVERFKDKHTVMLFNHKNELTNVEDVNTPKLEDVELHMKEHLNITGLRKLDVFEKFRFLAYRSWHVIIIRHEELTRCGEYIELAYLILHRLPILKITLLIREGIPISTMLKELIRMTRLYHERYKDLNDLLYIVRSIINNLIKGFIRYK